jgi:hypothetical protein
MQWGSHCYSRVCLLTSSVFCPCFPSHMVTLDSCCLPASCSSNWRLLRIYKADVGHIQEEPWQRHCSEVMFLGPDSLPSWFKWKPGSWRIFFSVSPITPGSSYNRARSIQAEQRASETKVESWPELLGILQSKCCTLDLECPPKAHVLEVWSSAWCYWWAMKPLWSGGF